MLRCVLLQVVDYVTQYSGIKPGDLDATRSSKHITTLKAAYLKLLFLLQRGVQFVGHGLKKDFRVINIFVCTSIVCILLVMCAAFTSGSRLPGSGHSGAVPSPKAEIYLTQVSCLVLSQSVHHAIHHLYAFSSSTILLAELHVQDGAHDSAEDAKTALQLYRCYQRLQMEARLQDSLGQLYETGRRLNWQIPNP